MAWDKCSLASGAKSHIPLVNIIELNKPLTRTKLTLTCPGPYRMTYYNTTFKLRQLNCTLAHGCAALLHICSGYPLELSFGLEFSCYWH